MANTIWGLFVELRKELIEAQKIRAQIMGFKFTFISASMALLIANIEDLDPAIFVIPAFAAIFFDFIIHSYSFSVKRIGCYVREHIEPALEKPNDVPEDFVWWQQFLTQPKTKQHLVSYGNIGATVSVSIIGFIALFLPFRPLISSGLCLALCLFIIMDIVANRSYAPLS